MTSLEEKVRAQRDFLKYVETNLDTLIEGEANEGNLKALRAVVREELALVRESIFKENAYWENSEKLKELEKRFAAFEETEDMDSPEPTKGQTARP